MTIKKYGKTKEEVWVKDITVAREIVSEVLNFGVSQQQLIRIIKFLSLELEDREMMENINAILVDPLSESPDKKPQSSILT